MGAEPSKRTKRHPVLARGHCQSRWSALLSSLGVSIPLELRKLCAGGRPMVQDRSSADSEHQDPTGVGTDCDLPITVSMFLPEFPHRSVPGHEQFQFLGYIAKGSFGPILKVKDRSKKKIYAVKVVPKSEVLRLGILKQSKEEVIIQRQVHHPFLHDLQDCWQTQRHLFIMCDYCSTGDLFTYWVMSEHFEEDIVRVFGAELGSALGFLHDFGIIHRDVKMENVLLTNQGAPITWTVMKDSSHIRLTDFGLSCRLERGGRTFTICGTIQYMAPEVLCGGPYSHAADWWSLGILLFALASGKFPVPPEPDHYLMVNKVQTFVYEMPATFSPSLALLLTDLLCKTPTQRVRTLERFQSQLFFRGLPSDSCLLQRKPVELILELKNRPDRPVRARRGLSPDAFHDFDCDLLGPPVVPVPDLPPSLGNTPSFNGSSAEIFV